MGSRTRKNSHSISQSRSLSVAQATADAEPRVATQAARRNMYMFRPSVGTAIGAPHVRFSTPPRRRRDRDGVSAFRGPALGASTPARASSTGARPRGPRVAFACAARPGPRGRAPVAAPRARERARSRRRPGTARRSACSATARRAPARPTTRTSLPNRVPRSSASVLSVAASVADSQGSTRTHAAVAFHPRLPDAGFSRDWTRMARSRRRSSGGSGTWRGCWAACTSSPPWPPPRQPRRGAPVAPAARDRARGFLAFVEVCFKTMPPAGRRRRGAMRNGERRVRGEREGGR